MRYFIFLNSFVKDFTYLFLERGEGEEKEGEKHQCVVASHVCPDWELNLRPFGSQAGT